MKLTLKIRFIVIERTFASFFRIFHLRSFDTESRNMYGLPITCRSDTSIPQETEVVSILDQRKLCDVPIFGYFGESRVERNLSPRARQSQPCISQRAPCIVEANKEEMQVICKTVDIRQHFFLPVEKRNDLFPMYDFIYSMLPASPLRALFGVVIYNRQTCIEFQNQYMTSVQQTSTLQGYIYVERVYYVNIV